jgi:hypothetical protein
MGEKRTQILTSTLKSFIDSIFPQEMSVFLPSDETNLQLEWKELKQVPKMQRFHLNDYKKQNGIGNFEELVSHLNMKKLQHKRFRNFIFPRLVQVSREVKR